MRWPLTIVDEETLGLSKADLDRLREEEPERLWGYFAESAPYMITANTARASSSAARPRSATA